MYALQVRSIVVLLRMTPADSREVTFSACTWGGDTLVLTNDVNPPFAVLMKYRLSGLRVVVVEAGHNLRVHLRGGEVRRQCAADGRVHLCLRSGLPNVQGCDGSRDGCVCFRLRVGVAVTCNVSSLFCRNSGVLPGANF